MNKLNDYIINYVRLCCLTMFLFLFIFSVYSNSISN